MSCHGRAEGLQQKCECVVFPLCCWEDRASLSVLLLPFGKLSQGEHELGSPLAYAGFYQEQILELRPGPRHSLCPSFMCRLGEVASLGGLGKLPRCWGSLERGGWLISAVELYSGHGGGRLSCFTN